MSQYDFDLITIGAGSGGVRASRIAATHGAKTAIIEEDRPGGTCVLRGCVPKKLLVFGSQFGADFEDSVGFGWHKHSPVHDWAALIKRKDDELDRLAAAYQNMLDNAGVEVISGRGILADANSVSVNGKVYSGARILIATGGWPQMPPIEGLEQHAITSNEALNLERRPDEVVVLGSGYIAVEFAGIFNGLGAKTHLVYRQDLPLRGFDGDIRQALADAMHERGVILHPKTTITKVVGGEADKQISLSDGSVITADTLMAATGRKPMTDNLGLENIGLDTDAVGAIAVNAENQTKIKSIYAIGDVTNRVNLTPVAIAEGHALADRLYGDINRQVDYSDIATAVFSQPPIASVGLSEQDAADKGKGRQVRVYISSFNAMKNTISGRREKTLMKLVIDASSDKVVGAHMIGVDAPEIIQGVAIAIKAGASKADFDATIGIHPTSAEEFVTMRTPRD